MRAKWCLLVVAGVGLACATAGAGDWPQWRGPERNGISSETGLLKEWPKGGPKLVWQAKDIDFGYSTPSVVGDRIYLLSNKGMDDEFVQALSTADGKRVWSRKIGAVGKNQGPNYPGSRSTPTVDGDRLYALGSDGDLACLETANGGILWKKNLRKEFGGRPGMWAYSESPLIDGEVLVCTPGGVDATIVALNKRTGDLIWKSAVPGGDNAGYASAIVHDVGGNKEYVQFVSKGVVGVDAKTGKFLWRYDKTAKGSTANIPTPVAQGDYVYTGTGLGGGGLVRLKPKGDAVETEPGYFSKDLPTSIGGAVLLGNFLYGTNQKALLCVEFTTGKVKWQEKSVAPASVCFADGRLYLHGESGEVALVEPSPDGYAEKGRFSPPNLPPHKRERAWSYPVVANGRLYLRDLGTMWCYDIRGEKDAK